MVFFQHFLLMMAIDDFLCGMLLIYSMRVLSLEKEIGRNFLDE